MQLNRIIYIAAGLVVGGLAGALITYGIMNRDVADEDQDSLVAENLPVQLPDEADDQEADDNDENGHEGQTHSSEEYEDQDTDIDSTYSDSTLVNDMDFPDSLADGSEDIRILEDQLVGTKKIKISYLDTLGGNSLTTKSDSAMAAHLDIREEKRPQQLEVEFWSSPINYSGYRLGKNKLMIFGIRANDPISLYGKEETIYLHTSKGLFELNRCDEFEQLRIITDQEFVSSIVNEN